MLARIAAQAKGTGVPVPFLIHSRCLRSGVCFKKPDAAA